MKRKGFTLIEIMLVVVIIGILLAVIIPRAQRASTDSKFAVVKQAATELGGRADGYADELASIGVATKAATLTALDATGSVDDGTGGGAASWLPIWQRTMSTQAPLVNPFDGSSYRIQTTVNAGTDPTSTGYLRLSSATSGTNARYYMIWWNNFANPAAWYGGQVEDSYASAIYGVMVAQW